MSIYNGKSRIMEISDNKIPLQVKDAFRIIINHHLGKSSEKERDNYIRFLSHIYTCTYINKRYKKSEYVPIPARKLEIEFSRKFKITDLSDFLNSKEYSFKNRKCREFKPSHFVVLNLKGNSLQTKVSKPDTEENIKGKKITNMKNKQNNWNHTKLIQRSVKCLRPFAINLTAIDEFRAEAYVKVKRLINEVNQMKINSEEYKKHEKENSYFLYLLDHLMFSMAPIIDNLIIREEEINGAVIGEYLADYEIQTSGRITELRGGFQNTDKFFKHLMMKDLNYYNYDLKNSQAYFLLEELHHCKIRCKWLENYLNDPDMKNQLSEEIGISVSVFKSCFYALIMGSNLNINFVRYDKNLGGFDSPNSIFSYIYKYCKRNKKTADQVHALFKQKLKPLTQAIKKWHCYLYQGFDKRYHYMHNGTKFWKNACGLRYKACGIKDGKFKCFITDPIDAKTCKRIVAAIILQGIEALYVHSLIIKCTENGINVYKNEYDGLITDSEIPADLPNKVAAEIGLKKVKPVIEIKPICSKKRIDKFAEMLK